MKRTAKCLLAATAAATLTTVSPGIASAADMPDSRCLVNFICYISVLDDYSMYMHPRVPSGQCVRTHVSSRKYWNRTQYQQRVWLNGDCTGTNVVLNPGAYWNSTQYYNSIGGY